MSQRYISLVFAREQSWGACNKPYLLNNNLLVLKNNDLTRNTHGILIRLF